MLLKNQAGLAIAMELLSTDIAAFIVYSVHEHKENYKRIKNVVQELCLAEDLTEVQTKLKKIVTHLGNAITSDWSGENFYEKERTEIQKAYDLLCDIYVMITEEK